MRDGCRKCARGLLVACLGVLLCGCAAGPPPLPICPGKPTLKESLRTLATYGQDAVPLRANGEALLTYHVPDKKKPERHILPMKMWFNPPIEIYIQGSIAVDPRAVTVGSNEKEFWLALRPKEMNAFYRGQWQDVRDVDGLLVSPRVVLEAFGIVVEPNDVANSSLWTMENKGPYDILTRRDEAGRLLKRVYVHACTYLVRRIEHFDPEGQIALLAQFRKYKPVAGGFHVPTAINLVSTAPDGRKDFIRIDITSTKVMEFSEPQRRYLFVPKPDTFENVYRYENGQWVPE